MKKVKYRFFLDFEKEEKWINEMAQEGWHLQKFSLGRFTFTQGERGTYIYRNEFVHLSSPEKEEYLEFIRDSGITVVHEFGGWVYMRKHAEDGPFELYSDMKSKIAYYKRLLNLFLLLLAVNAWMGIVNISEFWDSTASYMIGPYIGLLNLLAVLLMAYPVVKIIKRKRALEKEQQFFE